MKKINAFYLKLIAITGMATQHFIIIVNPDIDTLLKEILIGFGGLTFIIMAYLLVEGYKHTRDIKKYMMRLFIFALISIYPFYFGFSFDYVFGIGSQNVIFTLFIGLVLMYLDEKIDSNIIFMVCFFIALLISVFFDWAVVGPIMIFLLYKIKDEKLRILSAALVGILASLVSMKFFAVGIFISALLLLLYDGKRGPNLKYLFYIFYPLHLIIFGIMARLY